MKRFDRDELQVLYDRHQICPSTRALIEQAFRQPTRRVESTLRSSAQTGACPKMRVVIQAASRTVERPAVLSYLFDDSVPGYLDRPFDLNVVYRSRSQRTVRRNLHPQFLVFGPNGFFIEDWVSDARARALLKGSPRTV